MKRPLRPSRRRFQGKGAKPPLRPLHLAKPPIPPRQRPHRRLWDVLCFLLGLLFLFTALYRHLPPKSAAEASVTLQFRTELRHSDLEEPLRALRNGRLGEAQAQEICVASVSPLLLPPSRTAAPQALPSQLQKEAFGTLVCTGAWRDGCFFAEGRTYLAPGMHLTLSDKTSVFWVEILSNSPNSA